MTDQYSVCETAVMTKLRTLTNLFPETWQVSNTVEVIQRGADHFAILMPDAFPATRVDGHDVFVNWMILIDLYVRFSTIAESLTRFKAARSAIFNLFHPASLISTAGVGRIALASSGGIQQDIPGDNPNFIIQTLSLTIQQRVSFDF